MEAGKNYIVRYQIPGVNVKPRECVMRYVAETEDRYIFSMRPIGGTQDLEKKWILAIFSTDRPVKAPTIFKGADVRVM